MGGLRSISRGGRQSRKKSSKAYHLPQGYPRDLRRANTPACKTTMLQKHQRQTLLITAWIGMGLFLEE